MDLGKKIYLNHYIYIISQFLNIFLNSEILQNGSWSSRGCKLNEDDSSETRTVCECNHLTHFAILLSPKPPEFSKNEVIALGIIGYVGVSISLLAITLTIITFIAFK